METTINIFTIMQKRLRLSGSILRARPTTEKARLAAGLKMKFWPLIDAGAISPVIHKTFPLAEAANAHKLMESGAHIGKIILTTDQK